MKKKEKDYQDLFTYYIISLNKSLFLLILAKIKTIQDIDKNSVSDIQTDFQVTIVLNFFGNDEKA